MVKTEPSPDYPGVATQVYPCFDGARIVIEGLPADLRAAGFIDESTPIPRTKQGTCRFGDEGGFRTKISMFGNGLLRIDMPMAKCSRTGFTRTSSTSTRH